VEGEGSGALGVALVPRSWRWPPSALATVAKLSGPNGMGSSLAQAGGPFDLRVRRELVLFASSTRAVRSGRRCSTGAGSSARSAAALAGGSPVGTPER